MNKECISTNRERDRIYDTYRCQLENMDEFDLDRIVTTLNAVKLSPEVPNVYRLGIRHRDPDWLTRVDIFALRRWVSVVVFCGENIASRINWKGVTTFELHRNLSSLSFCRNSQDAPYDSSWYLTIRYDGHVLINSFREP